MELTFADEIRALWKERAEIDMLDDEFDRKRKEIYKKYHNEEPAI